jgi:hypothetical protein
MQHAEALFVCIIAVKHKFRIAFVNKPGEYKEVSEGEACFFNPKDVQRIAGGKHAVVLPLVFANKITGVFNGGFCNLLTTYREAQLLHIRLSGKVEVAESYVATYRTDFVACLRKMREYQLEYTTVVQLFRGHGCRGVTWDTIGRLLNYNRCAFIVNSFAATTITLHESVMF